MKIRIAKENSSTDVLTKVAITAAGIGLVVSGGGIIFGAYLAEGILIGMIATSISAASTEVVWFVLSECRGYTVRTELNCLNYCEPRIDISEFEIKYTLGKWNINFIE